jgi:hypothetical protein
MLSSIINGGPSPSSLAVNGNVNGSISSSTLGIAPTTDGGRQDEPALDDIVLASVGFSSTGS